MHFRMNCWAIGLLLWTNLALAENPSIESPIERPTVTIVGQDGKEFDTLQKAIDTAPSGAVIQLSAGRFNERVVINKSITLVGAGNHATILGPTKSEQEDRWDKATTLSHKIDDIMRSAEQANPRREPTQEETESIKLGYQEMSPLVETCLQPVVLVEGTKKVMLRSLGVTMPLTPNEGSGLQVTAAVKVNNAETQLNDCAIVGCMSSGVVVAGTSRLEIENCLVAACWGTGISASHPNDAKVHIANSDIRNNYHYNIGLGVDNCVIEGCRISGTAWSGVSAGAKQVLVERNAIFNNSNGIYSVGKNGIVRNNLLYRNNAGASCWSSDEPLYEANLFLENKLGALFVGGPAKLQIQQNLIVDSPIGVKYGPMKIARGQKPAATEFLIKDNVFWKVGIPAILSPSPEDESQDKPIAILGSNGNRLVDPHASIGDQQRLKIGNDDITQELNLTALTNLTLRSPWPVTPEELAMIPDDGTVDSSKWKKRPKVLD